MRRGERKKTKEKQSGDRESEREGAGESAQQGGKEGTGRPAHSHQAEKAGGGCNMKDSPVTPAPPLGRFPLARNGQCVQGRP